MHTTLELRGVAACFDGGHGRVSVFDGLDLAVGRSECVALTGPSGSGKTTLLHIAAGLRAPASGSVTLVGQSMHETAARLAAELRARRLGMVFQAFHLLPHLSAEDNVALPSLLAGCSRRDATARAGAALSRVGLESRARHRPEALSGGEQQRVAVARAIVNRPALVLADEPTGNLDHAATLLVAGLLADIARDGTAVLVATHDPVVAGFADRIVELGAATASE
jgi:putative ABC transport system ATP-binding protein